MQQQTGSGRFRWLIRGRQDANRGRSVRSRGRIKTVTIERYIEKVAHMIQPDIHGASLRQARDLPPLGNRHQVVHVDMRGEDAAITRDIRHTCNRIHRHAVQCAFR